MSYEQRLLFQVQDADISGEPRHPQTVMQELGIVYQYAQPIMLMDCWVFWNCEGVPASLPKYIQRAPVDLYSKGLSLSQELIEKIANYKPKQPAP